MAGVVTAGIGLLLAAIPLTGETPVRSAESLPPVQTAEPHLGDREEPFPQSTAEDILKALQTERPRNRLIEPASVLARGGEPARRLLWPEGITLVGRTGRLVEEGRWWTFVPDEDTDLGPLKMLPDTTLEAMVRSSRGSNTPSQFVVTGDLAVFQDENYLLPRFATRTATAIAATRPGGPSPVYPPEADDEAAAGNAPDETVRPDAPVDDVLKRLQSQRPTEAMMAVTPADPDSEPAADRSSVGGRALQPEGSALVERPGRIVAEGDWWLFLFESDDLESPEPPMKLLPNLNTELMVAAAQRDMTGLVFVVSGEVTLYFGENYLLPRAARRRIDSGNLRK